MTLLFESEGHLAWWAVELCFLLMHSGPYLASTMSRCRKSPRFKNRPAWALRERNTELFRHVPAHIQQKSLENIKNIARLDSGILQKQMDFRKVSSRLVYAACIKEV